MKENKCPFKETIKHYFSHKSRNSALIIGHRGAKSLAKVENTLEAFQIAIDMQLKMIEFDVRRTKDNQLIVFHNDHINHKKLNTLTYEEMCLHTSAENFTPPLFEEVIKTCSGKIMLDIELKEAGYEAEVLDLLKTYYTTEQYIITSFLDSVIKKIKLLNPSIKAGLLLGLGNASLLQRFSEFFPIKRLKSTQADFVAANYRLVTPWLLRHCKKHGYHIYVWTVNADDVYTKLIRNKVSGIITDYPQRYSGQYSAAS